MRMLVDVLIKPPQAVKKLSSNNGSPPGGSLSGSPVRQQAGATFAPPPLPKDE